MGSLAACFERTVSKVGSKTALTWLRHGRKETELSYEELDRDADRMAHRFLEMGVGKGDRVLLFFSKSLVFVVAHLALQKIGAVSVPLNPGFKKSEMRYFIADADPALILAGPEQHAVVAEIDPHRSTLVLDTTQPYAALSLLDGVREERVECKPEPKDPGVIIYTSGTTGNPKGAVLTQGNLVHDAKTIIRIWEIRETDTLCHALPLFHVHGLCFALHTALIAGARVILLDRFSPEAVVRVLSDKGPDACTVFMAVPAMYAKLLDYLGEEKRDFGHVRLWTSGSAPLLPKDFERITRVFGKEPVEREGMSETGMNFSNPLHGKKKPGSIGLPLPDLQVRLVDPETGKDVERGEVGEIWLKGPSITPGYWRKPHETEKAFVEGWFRTGDLARMDEEGYYYLTDRIKHIIISGGENISPKEIENVLNALPEVAESCVVGIPDEKWGEKVVAALVPASNSRFDFRDIRNHCREHLHDWKCPKEIVWVEELPKNTMGKVLTEEVKKLFSRCERSESKTG